jgi:hypothetical protein
MVPRARTTQRWPLRPWRSQRKMYVVIYRGALRRRMRRLILRDFNNVRTAIRNDDLAIRELHPQLLLRAWVDSGQCMAATTAGFLHRAAEQVVIRSSDNAAASPVGRKP